MRVPVTLTALALEHYALVVRIALDALDEHNGASSTEPWSNELCVLGECLARALMRTGDHATCAGVVFAMKQVGDSVNLPWFKTVLFVTARRWATSSL